MLAEFTDLLFLELITVTSFVYNCCSPNNVSDTFVHRNSKLSLPTGNEASGNGTAIPLQVMGNGKQETMSVVAN